jgi:hypothetical protein
LDFFEGLKNEDKQPLEEMQKKVDVWVTKQYANSLFIM